MTSANAEQAQYWSERAASWIEIEDQTETIIGEPGRLAMDRLRLHPGERVLDLGCGTGRTTLEIGARVGREGWVIGVDISAEMLVRAREHASTIPIRNVEFVNADAQTHDLGRAAFDAAYSRFGVMFFSDPAAAFSNVRQSLRSGGRVSFVCWMALAENEWMMVPGMTAVSVIGETPPAMGPEEPGPFSLSDPERLHSILTSAGMTNIDISPHRSSVSFSEEQIPEVATLATRVGAVREMLQESTSDLRERVVKAIEAELRSRLVDGEVRLSRSVFLVSAAA